MFRICLCTFSKKTSLVTAGERRASARELILARRKDSDGEDVWRNPDVSELEISWASGEREQQAWKEKELKKDEEDPKREKEPGGEVEEQEGEPIPPPCSFLFDIY
jgi:hypothetical protein